MPRDDLSDDAARPARHAVRTLKLRTMQVKTFDEVNLLALEGAVNTWLKAAGEATYHGIVWDHDHPDYTAMIIFTEE